jgi:hypothetical protein
MPCEPAVPVPHSVPNMFVVRGTTALRDGTRHYNGRTEPQRHTHPQKPSSSGSGAAPESGIPASHVEPVPRAVLCG